MKIGISEHFSYKKLIRFTLPSVFMMIFTSIYGVVDGFFVSNFVGKTPFAAINLIMPFLMLFGTVGFMIGTGGSALVAKTLGEGKSVKAKRLFSMLVLAATVLGVIFAAAGIVFLRPVSVLLGAEGEAVDMCVIYGRIILIASPLFILQNLFQSFLITAEKPKLALVATLAAGFTNIIFDGVLVGALRLGLVGAAVATALSQFAGAIIPVAYFTFSKHGTLRFVKPLLDGRAFIKTCANGSSELMTNFSLSLVNMLYNYKLLALAGEDGIAAYGVLMYVNFIFVSVFIGYSIGVAPIISFHYGAQNRTELKSLLRKSLVILAVSSTAITAAAELLMPTLANLYVSYDAALLEMTVHGGRIYSLCFIILGFNIFGSAFFTALNNGAVSATISFLRTLVLQCVTISVLPILLNLDGVWLSPVVVELAALTVTAFFLIKMKKRYGY